MYVVKDISVNLLSFFVRLFPISRCDIGRHHKHKVQLGDSVFEASWKDVPTVDQTLALDRVRPADCALEPIESVFFRVSAELPDSKGVKSCLVFAGWPDMDAGGMWRE